MVSMWEQCGGGGGGGVLWGDLSLSDTVTPFMGHRHGC